MCGWFVSGPIELKLHRAIGRRAGGPLHPKRVRAGLDEQAIAAIQTHTSAIWAQRTHNHKNCDRSGCNVTFIYTHTRCHAVMLECILSANLQFNYCHQLKGRLIPDLRGLVTGARCQPPVRQCRHFVHPISMAGEHLHALASVHVPDPHGLVTRARCRPPASTAATTNTKFPCPVSTYMPQRHVAAYDATCMAHCKTVSQYSACHGCTHSCIAAWSPEIPRQTPSEARPLHPAMPCLVHQHS